MDNSLIPRWTKVHASESQANFCPLTSTVTKQTSSSSCSNGFRDYKTMPMARVEVRNYYGLGVQELYRVANKEDPKEIFDGVTVAGLVGILRQLGDLAEFAADVFHGLQEEVMVMPSRSRNLRASLKQIESALSPLEKVVLTQRSHLHFAYTTGSNWYVHIQCDQNHFVYSDVPQFIMDSYEDCRSHPRLQFLDRFDVDPGGLGSCLKRYSDPNLFKRESVSSGEVSDEKVTKDKKRLRIKKAGHSTQCW